MRTGGRTKSNRSLPHLIGCSIRESYCANIVRPHPRINESRNSIRNNTGLAAAGTGQNKQWAFNMKNCRPEQAMGLQHEKLLFSVKKLVGRIVHRA
jgi:hypothetical protein